MEKHFTVGKNACRLAVHAHIGHVKDRGMAAALCRIEIVHRNAQLAEARRKPHLSLFAQWLTPNSSVEVSFPGTRNWRKASFVGQPAQVAAPNSHPDPGGQVPNLNHHSEVPPGNPAWPLGYAAFDPPSRG